MSGVIVVCEVAYYNVIILQTKFRTYIGSVTVETFPVILGYKKQGLET